MHKRSATLLAAIIFAAICASAFTPALALGGCGPNQHRSSVTGHCITGGQNQAWCVKHTGHAAVRGPGGTWVCVRT